MSSSIVSPRARIPETTVLFPASLSSSQPSSSSSPPPPTSPSPSFHVSSDSIEALKASGSRTRVGGRYSLRVGADASILTDRTAPTGSISVIFASQGSEKAEPGNVFGLLLDYGSYTKVVIKTMTQFKRLYKQIERTFALDDFPKISKSSSAESRRSSLEDFVRVINKNPKMRFSFHFRLFAEELDLRGKYYIVTGASSGLGKEVARNLAKSGATVIMGCRDPDRCKRAMDEIKAESAAAQLEYLYLELGSFTSIAQFALDYKHKKYPLHGLILNAGIAESPVPFTEEGYEMIFGVNYLGHFLLFQLLLPTLREANKSRVVVLSSNAHTAAKQLLISHKHVKRKVSGSFQSFPAYAESKLYCLMFAREISERFPPWISGITSIALHPGAVNTGIYKNMPAVFQWGTKALTPVEGCLSSLTATLSEDLEGSSNLYLDDLGLPSSSPSSVANDRNSWKMLWDASLGLIRPGIEDFQRLEEDEKEDSSSISFDVVKSHRAEEAAKRKKSLDASSDSLDLPKATGSSSSVTFAVSPRDAAALLESAPQITTTALPSSLSASNPSLVISSAADPSSGRKFSSAPAPALSAFDTRKSSDSIPIARAKSPFSASASALGNLPSSVTSSSPQLLGAPLKRSLNRAISSDTQSTSRARATSESIRSSLNPATRLNSWDVEVAEIARILSRKKDTI